MIELVEFLEFIQHVATMASVRKMASVPSTDLQWCPLREVPRLDRARAWQALLNLEITGIPFENAKDRDAFALSVCGVERGSCRVSLRYSLTSNPLANQLKFDVVQMFLLSQLTADQTPVQLSETLRRWLSGAYTEREAKEIKGNPLFDQSEEILKGLLRALEGLGGVRATTSPTLPTGPLIDPTIKMDDA
jgi:hypothetical protein